MDRKITSLFPNVKIETKPLEPKERIEVSTDSDPYKHSYEIHKPENQKQQEK